MSDRILDDSTYKGPVFNCVWYAIEEDDVAVREALSLMEEKTVVMLLQAALMIIREGGDRLSR